MNNKLFPHYRSIVSSIQVAQSDIIDSICFNSNDENPNIMDIVIKYKDSSVEKFSIEESWAKELQDSVCANVDCMNRNIESDKRLLKQSFELYKLIAEQTETECAFFINLVGDEIILTVYRRTYDKDYDCVFSHFIEFEEDFLAKYNNPNLNNLKMYLANKICEEIFNIVDHRQKDEECNIHLKDIYKGIEACSYPVLPLEDDWEKDFVFKHLIFEEEKEIMEFLKNFKI